MAVVQIFSIFKLTNGQIGSGLKIKFRPKGRFQDHSWPFLTIFCPFVCCPNIYCIVQFSKCWQMAKSFLNSIGSGLKIQFRPKGRFQDHSWPFLTIFCPFVCCPNIYCIVQFSKCWQMAKSFLNSIGSGLKIQFRPKGRFQDHSWPFLTIFCPFVCCPNIYCIVQFSKCWQMAKSFLNSIGSGLKIKFRPKGRFQDHSWPFLTIFCPFVCCPNIYCIVQFSKCWQMAKSFLNSIGSGLKIQFRPKGRFQDHSWPFLTIFCPFVCCPNIYCIVQFSKCWQMAKSFLNSIGSGLKIQFRPKGRFQDHSWPFLTIFCPFVCCPNIYCIVQFSKCWQMAKSFLNSIGSGLKIQFRPKGRFQDHSWPFLTIFCPFVCCPNIYCIVQFSKCWQMAKSFLNPIGSCLKIQFRPKGRFQDHSWPFLTIFCPFVCCPNIYCIVQFSKCWQMAKSFLNSIGSGLKIQFRLKGRFQDHSWPFLTIFCPFVCCPNIYCIVQFSKCWQMAKSFLNSIWSGLKIQILDPKKISLPLLTFSENILSICLLSKYLLYSTIFKVLTNGQIFSKFNWEWFKNTI